MKTRKTKSDLCSYVKRYMEKQLSHTIEDARIFKNTILSRGDAWKQYGGVIKYIEMTPYIFKYDETNDRILALSKKKKLPCFRIDFFREDRTIGLDISYYGDSCDNENILLPNSNGVQLMLNAAIAAVFQRKDVKYYNRIYLTDNSGKKLETDKESIVNLADMYFICTGCTWYSTLIPMFLEKEPEHNSFIQFRKNIIGSFALSWNDLLKGVSEKCKFDLENIREIYKEEDASSPGSASRILNTIRMNRQYSYIFYNYMDEMLRAFSITSLYAKSWIIPMKMGKIISCDDDIIQTSCKNKGRWLVPEQLLQNVPLNEWNALMKTLQQPIIESPF